MIMGGRCPCVTNRVHTPDGAGLPRSQWASSAYNTKKAKPQTDYPNGQSQHLGSNKFTRPIRYRRTRTQERPRQLQQDVLCPICAMDGVVLGLTLQHATRFSCPPEGEVFATAHHNANYDHDIHLRV